VKLAGVPIHRPIRALDEATVGQIAAGEVVDRPSSVVKELVENAIDAGSTEVVVRLANGGLESIEVSDNGIGIPESELALAVARHATSKLTNAGELASVVSLGFRGEALAAIGAVSRLRLYSRTPDSEEAHGVSLVAGELSGRFVAGRAPGTTAEVRDLFFNTPARRKFLKSPVTEQLDIVAAIERLYLARPDVSISLYANAREVERLTARSRLRDAATTVLGIEFAEQAIEIEPSKSPAVSIEAVVSRPALSRPTAQGIYIAVNGRPVISRALGQAVRLAYAAYLPKSRFPLAVVHLTLAPGEVDVNVHPTKREVRFAKPAEVADALRRAIRAGLLGAPQVADRGVSATPPERSEPARSPPGPATLASTLVPGLVAPGPFGPLGRSTRQQRLGSAAVRRRIGGEAGHPSVELLGSLMDLYWVAEGQDGLVLIDQHAASERVLFDALLKDGRLGRQHLVEPVRVPLTPRQVAVLETEGEEIRAAGFEVVPFGPGTFRVVGVPSYRGRTAPAEALPGLLEEIAAGGRPTVPAGGPERRAASIACHSAVRAGERISTEEMARLMGELRGLAETGYACPHGRPIAVRLARRQIDRWFLRSTP